MDIPARSFDLVSWCSAATANWHLRRSCHVSRVTWRTAFSLASRSSATSLHLCEDLAVTSHAVVASSIATSDLETFQQVLSANYHQVSQSNDRSKFQHFFATFQHYKFHKKMTFSSIVYGLLTRIRQQKNYGQLYVA